jgi:hypothetical protein
VAEHCYAALGDISKSAYLRRINKLVENYEKETGRKVLNIFGLINIIERCLMKFNKI